MRLEHQHAGEAAHPVKLGKPVGTLRGANWRGSIHSRLKIIRQARFWGFYPEAKRGIAIGFKELDVERSHPGLRCFEL
jgi:hypothetical protein